MTFLEAQETDTGITTEVARVASTLGARADRSSTRVRIAQTGEMRDSLFGRWKTFSAKQSICLRQVGFCWEARMGPLGCMQVSDSLVEERGRLEVWACGVVPITTLQNDAQLTRGETIRYLAELPWAPDAILQNKSLRWLVRDEDAIEVEAGDGDTRVRVALKLDARGRVSSTEWCLRPRWEGGGFVERPWCARFFDYRSVDGRWIPFGGEARWRIEGREFTTWRGSLNRWFVDDDTFTD